jgi:hypothetical protein
MPDFAVYAVFSKACHFSKKEARTRREVALN